MSDSIPEATEISSAADISTDTSLLHLSANLGALTYAILTVGCEWRWTRDLKTNWYPNTILLRQTSVGDWSNVIKDIMKIV